MKQRKLMLSVFVGTTALFLLGRLSVNAQTGNVGIGTTTPTTKLDVNGAVTNREGVAIAVSGATVTVPNLAYSQYRLTGSPTAAFTITGPTTSNGSLALVAGARMILVNTTAQIGTLNGTPIQPGSAQEFAYTNGAWVATNGGARPDYDWMKTGNTFPTAPADTVTDIYHMGHVGVGTRNSLYTLQVQASANNDNTIAKNIVAMFDPAGGGGSPANPATIALNGGRAYFGYDTISAFGKYAYVRGNQSTDIRLQVVASNGVLYDKPVVVQASGGIGFVGINNNAPQSQLDVRGTVKVLATDAIQSGTIWNGNSNMSGFEITTNATNGDMHVGIQRNGPFAGLFLSKPAGTTSPSRFLDFVVANSVVGTITYTGSGVAYNVTSDVRLKEDIRVTKYSLDELMKIKVTDYFYKSDKDHLYPQTGFLAQQLYDIFPAAVTKGGEDEKEKPWMVDYSKITPLLVKAVQELNNKMEVLEKENAALKARDETVAQLAQQIKELQQDLSRISAISGVKESKGSERAKK